MKPYIDLGQPVLLLILILWGGFAISALAAAFLRPANLKELKQTLQGFFDETPHGRRPR